jgi:hypothetical protein
VAGHDSEHLQQIRQALRVEDDSGDGNDMPAESE